MVDTIKYLLLHRAGVKSPDKIDPVFICALEKPAFSI